MSKQKTATTLKSVQAELSKRNAALAEKKNRLENLRKEILAEKKELKQLERTEESLFMEAQKQRLTSLAFKKNMSRMEITDAINAFELQLSQRKAEQTAQDSSSHTADDNLAELALDTTHNLIQ